jgi:hypothetical protein
VQLNQKHLIIHVANKLVHYLFLHELIEIELLRYDHNIFEFIIKNILFIGYNIFFHLLFVVNEYSENILI